MSGDDSFNDTESDLLPCPFCGGEAERHDIEALDGEDNAGSSYIECEGCGACTQLHFDRKEHLVSSWNERTAQVTSDDADDARYYREECGKLHAQLVTAKDQRNEYQKREQSAQHILAAIRKVRDGYADQAKFSDIDASVYFREFVRRLDLAVAGKSGNEVPPWGGAVAEEEALIPSPVGSPPTGERT